MYRDAAVEVIRIPERAELALFPSAFVPRERELARRGHGILTTVIATAEASAASRRGGGDQNDLPVLPDNQNLSVKIDFDVVRGLRVDEWFGEFEVCDGVAGGTIDPTSAGQPVELLNRFNGVAGFLVEGAVDRTWIEVKCEQSSFEVLDGRTR